MRRIDHVGIIVHDLDAAKQFFIDLGLEVVGAGSVQGEWVGDVIGLKDVHADLLMLRTPDGGSNIELSKIHSPADSQPPDAAAANRLGIRHIAFVVEDVNGLVDKMRAKGFNTVGTVHDYEDVYRLCYVRGPGGIIVELAEEIGSAEAR